MNNTKFRFYIKDMPNSIIVEDFGMRPIVFKGICQLISLYGSYETGTTLKMSWRSISEQAGVDRKTAFKVRDILLQNGLLIEKNKLTTNISVYDLGSVVPYEDLRGPFSDLPTGHNSISYIDIIEEDESSSEDSFDNSNTKDLFPGETITLEEYNESGQSSLADIKAQAAAPLEQTEENIMAWMRGEL